VKNRVSALMLCCTYITGESPQQTTTCRPNEETHQENDCRRNLKQSQPQSEMARITQADKQRMKALELYNRVKILDAQRESSNKSLMLAAAGVAVLVGGAAATAAEKKETSQIWMWVALFGGLAELCGLVAFVRSA